MKILYNKKKKKGGDVSDTKNTMINVKIHGNMLMYIVDTFVFT